MPSPPHISYVVYTKSIGEFSNTCTIKGIRKKDFISYKGTKKSNFFTNMFFFYINIDDINLFYI